MRANRCLAVAVVICLACPAFGQVADDEPATLPAPAQELPPAAPDQRAGAPPAEQAEAPVEILWQRQFGTDVADYATGLGLDSEGNCYVTGSTEGLLGEEHLGERDIFIIKYDHNGDRLWLRQVGTANVDKAYDIAVDGDGNCFVTGVTTGSFGGEHAGGGDAFLERDDAFLLKCNDEGDVLWVRQIGGEGMDRGAGVAADGKGNSYICGTTFCNLVDGGPSSTTDIFVAKYDPDGTQLWIRQFGAGKHDEANDIAVTADGGICVVGTGDMVEGAQGDGQGLVFYCDSDGNWLSGDQFGEDMVDTANCVTADAAGNCYVAGFLWEGGTRKDDIFVARYDGDHLQQWLVQTGTEEPEGASGVAVDDSGIYIAGRTGGSLLARDGLRDGLLIKYGFDGAEQWRWQFGSDDWDKLVDIALDAEGNCYIVGYSEGALAGENQGSADAFIIVLSPTAGAADDGTSDEAQNDKTSDDVPHDGRDDASNDDAPADDPAGNSSAD